MPVTATTIRQIELQLYKAEQGLGMPYDAERVAQLRGMLREARKQKLSQALAAKRPPRDFFRQLAINYRQLAEIAGNPEIKQRMIDMAAHYQAKADEEAMTGEGAFTPDAKGEETIGGGRVSGGCANARA
jgi:hypothetical protein